MVIAVQSDEVIQFKRIRTSKQVPGSDRIQSGPNQSSTDYYEGTVQIDFSPELRKACTPTGYGDRSAVGRGQPSTNYYDHFSDNYCDQPFSNDYDQPLTNYYDQPSIVTTINLLLIATEETGWKSIEMKRVPEREHA